MSDQSTIRGVYYFDLIAVLLLGLIVVGHLVTLDSPASPPPAGDVAGFWLPLASAVLLAAFRQRAYAQATPWIAGSFAAAASLAVAVVFWRWHLVAFVAALATATLLAAVGLILRSKRARQVPSRSDVFTLVLLVSGIAVGVLLTEGILRVAPGLLNPEVQRMLQADARNYGIAHPYIGHLHRPHNSIVLSGRDFHAVHNVDGLGFRNSWPWPDEAEIVIVGDSLTFGYGVADEEAWPTLLAGSVAPLRVVNLGLIGAGPQQYLRLFETFGVALRPKLVLVGVFPQNDFWDAQMFDRWTHSGAGGNYMVWRDFGRARPLRFSLRDPLDTLERFAGAKLYPALRATYFYTLLRALRGGVEGPAPAPARIYRFGDGSQLQLRASEYLAMSRLTVPGHPAFKLLLEALQQIDELATRQGAHALMILQPGKEEVYLPLLGETRGDPSAALRAALDELNIDYLDLAPGFRARAEAGERLFFEVDGHPNRAGYALTAQLVNEHLMRNAARYGLITEGGQVASPREAGYSTAVSRQPSSRLKR